MSDKELSKEQSERLREAAKSYKEMEKMIEPFLGEAYRRAVVPDEWFRGDQRLGRTAARTNQG